MVTIAFKLVGSEQVHQPRADAVGGRLLEMCTTSPTLLPDEGYPEEGCARMPLASRP